MEIRITTLGRLRIRVGGAVRTGRLELCALLVYLAVERDVERRSVLELFWPGREPADASDALRRALDELSRTLGDGWLAERDDRLRVDEAVEVDAVAFERAVERGDADAHRLYHGPFLPGERLVDSPSFVAWADRTRDRLERLHRRAGETAPAGSSRAPAGAVEPRRDVEPGRSVFARARQLYRELRRRRVFAVAVSYAAAAFVIVQAADVFFPALGLPDTALSFVAVVAIFGFPVVVILAWALEVTPEGDVRWETPADGGSAAGPLRRGALLGLIVLLAAAAWVVSDRFAPDEADGSTWDPPPEELLQARIAVLYFDDHSEGRHLGYLADGLTEALIHELGQVPTLQVISRNGVKPYRARDVPLDSIIRDLGAGSLVEGSIAGDDERVRVTVQLIDARTQAHLASRVLERPWEDRFRLETHLAREVSDLLRRELGQEIQLRESRAGTTNAEAWDAVQRALQLTNDGEALAAAGDLRGEQRLLRTADSLLARAERLDRSWLEPTIRRGWVALRQASGERALAAAGGDDASAGLDGLRRASGHAERALDRRSDAAEAFELRGTAAYRMWQLGLVPDSLSTDDLADRAELDLRAATAAEKPPARAYGTLGQLLNDRGEFAEARLLAERAYETDAFLDNAADLLFLLGQTSLDLEESRDALAWCEEGRRRFPERAEFPSCLLTVLAWTDSVPPDPELGRRLADEVVALSPPHYRATNRAIMDVQLAGVLARAGQADRARRVIERVRADTVTTGLAADLAYLEAGVRLRLGEVDHALRLLGSYLEARPQDRGYVAEDWLFRPLRDDRRFQRLIGG